MNYHTHRSPTSLTTVKDPLRGYPAYWELMKWYLCWRKTPYAPEIVAAILAEERGEAYAHYPCPLDDTHWHIGRGGTPNPRKQQFQQAKRVYRRAVRDEIWRRHVVRQEEEQRERRNA